MIAYYNPYAMEGYLAGISCLHNAGEERWTDVCAIHSKDGLTWRHS